MLPVAQAVAAPVPAMGPTCPRCGIMAVWQPQVGRWGCDRCRAYLDQMGAPQEAAKSAKRALAGKRVAVGLVLMIVGIAVTAGTYSSASRGGGTYFIAYGPIVVGAIRFFQGLGGLMV
jgi:ribosomal protein S27AE